MEELSLALTSLLGREVNSEESAKFAKRFDTNGDGVIDFEEFKQVSEIAKEKKTPNFFEELFFSNEEADKKASDTARAYLKEVEAAEIAENIVDAVDAEEEKKD